MPDVKNDVAGVVAPPPQIFGGAIAGGLLLHAIRPLPAPPKAVGRPLGAALVVAAVALFGSAVARQRRAGTNVETSKPTTALVTDGPYRLSRNPIYLAFTLFTTGVGLLAANGWILTLLPPTIAVVQRGVIEREERYLARRFGDDYERYRASVRRWL